MRGVAAVVTGFMILVGAGVANAESTRAPGDAAAMLNELGFSLQTSAPDKHLPTFTKRGLLVPTPWGDIEATIVSTSIDRMVRVPLPTTEPGQPLVQPYVTAGTRRNLDSDTVLQQVRPSAFADTGRSNGLKAGAGLLFKLDDNVELFGEYQFMRLNRDAEARGAVGGLGTTLDTSGFSLGLSVRY